MTRIPISDQKTSELCQIPKALNPKDALEGCIGGA